ncbi:hypothetical protein ACQ4N7_01720 [Nodosilinea sp. AN01ver1]|uniref:hypothetical protein n=1 Tax=Nodosilinea sp. AN01ver1 TaxID=3423362 RepID=UPI003D317AA1
MSAAICNHALSLRRSQAFEKRFRDFKRIGYPDVAKFGKKIWIAMAKLMVSGRI